MIENFRVLVQKVLPTVYDDSLSYYELLNKVVHYLNMVIDKANALGVAFENVLDDVLPENVEKVLNDWYADGTLADLINIDLMNTKADKTAVEENTKKISETIKTIPMPEKYGVRTNSPKLVAKGSTNNEFKVVQFNGQKYVVYTLDNSDGDSSANSVGGSWDLVRLKKAIMASNVYVAKTTYTNIIGTLNTLTAPALRNTVDDYLVYKDSVSEDSANFLTPDGTGLGLGIYGIVGSGVVSSVDFEVKIGTGNKCNLLVYGSGSASQDCDILVNGEVVKNFDSSKLALGTNLTFKIIEFEIPTRVTLSSQPVIVTLRNNDISGKKLYFSAMNFMWLKDYDGRDIDFYKVFTTSIKWIDHQGANDYAIFDKDLGKFCGSYHGGETAISQKATYATGASWYQPVDFESGKYYFRNLTDIPVTWYVIPSFKIQQLTNINGKGKMMSILDFDIDGTLQMNFSFFDGSINAETFYTALTNSHIDFNYIRYPRYEIMPEAPQNVYLKANEGNIIQFNSVKGISLGIRHTMFSSGNIPNVLKKSGWILNHPTYYKKYYYGPVQEDTSGVVVENLQFRKALDFMSE